jgi:dihydrofolate synthase / folylpolyglutamate synthase
VDYDAAVAALGSALRFGINPSLDGIRALTGALGRPQDAMSFVQVTGTNGKSSVTRMCAALLRAHGLRAAAYTSPHLQRYNERMEVDGEPVADADFARAIAAVLEAADRLVTSAEKSGAAAPAFTEFELLTAAALWLFRDLGVAWACLEVGLGGRWDATSVVSPAVAVVIGVALDHTERLGSTIDDIAADKAHVIKSGSIAVLGPGTAAVAPILEQRARGVAAPVVKVAESDADVTFRVVARPAAPGGTLTLEVDGCLGRYDGLVLSAPSYQAPNAATAVAAAEAALGRALAPEATREALAGMRFPGRFELVSAYPPVVLDGAHNPQAATVLAEAIREAFPQVNPVLVLGVLADKDAEGIVTALAPVSGGFVVTRPDSPRALDPADLAAIVERCAGVEAIVEPDLREALRRAEEAGDAVVVTGSLYTVGAVRGLLR